MQDPRYHDTAGPDERVKNLLRIEYSMIFRVGVWVNSFVYRCMGAVN